MRIISIAVLVVVLVGLLAWIALSDSNSTAAQGDELLMAGGSLATTATTCPTAKPLPEPKLAANISFAENGETVLDPCTLKVTGGKLLVVADGDTIGSFKLDGTGKMIPSGSQPDGNIVKATYSGPAGDSFTAYRIYPSNYEKGSGVAPLMAIDHSNGAVSVKSAGDITGNNGSNYNTRKNKYGGSLTGGSGASCSTGGGGGG